MLQLAATLCVLACAVAVLAVFVIARVLVTR